MFTGIVEELGEVAAVEDLGDSSRFRLRGPLVTQDARHGDSIAVNGVCLTVVDTAAGEFTADVMAETLNRSSLGALVPGSRVNLERPMALGGRLGGHLVQGHVDGTGTITERVPGEHWELVTVSLPARLARYVVEKGSITVDGVSLTVVAAADDHFTVSLIPTTLELTTLGSKKAGDPVNLEVDVLAKYVERLLGAGAVPAGAHATGAVTGAAAGAVTGEAAV
ncbi:MULTISPECIES: riboflavin synthase [Streptomyces]|uniref:Riboflavin synthase n=1 Tax=Streptomyces xinghaiensis TaxID=1038928 RepID=A0A3M8F8K2_9ACTN|nr:MULTISPECIES: riboflavin synthase [Streptomyces]PQM22371.1 riboflavin synthase subunit alpha [Streptomyces xinghaiensis]RKM96662.1 riboflavin synthase [Streptomyces xinghaiensis]RNC74186.1 riboflavin synthase [Streptomyces xinghaiensis]